MPLQRLSVAKPYRALISQLIFASAELLFTLVERRRLLDEASLAGLAPLVEFRFLLTNFLQLGGHFLTQRRQLGLFRRAARRRLPPLLAELLTGFVERCVSASREPPNLVQPAGRALFRRRPSFERLSMQHGQLLAELIQRELPFVELELLLPQRLLQPRRQQVGRAAFVDKETPIDPRLGLQSFGLDFEFQSQCAARLRPGQQARSLSSERASRVAVNRSAINCNSRA